MKLITEKIGFFRNLSGDILRIQSWQGDLLHKAAQSQLCAHRARRDERDGRRARKVNTVEIFDLSRFSRFSRPSCSERSESMLFVSQSTLPLYSSWFREY
jgi:hypothetical protein